MSGLNFPGQKARARSIWDVGTFTEKYGHATRELAQAVVAEDWQRALHALEERERVLPALDKVLASTGATASVVGFLAQTLQEDSSLMDQVEGAKTRILSEIKELDRMARWARGVQEAAFFPKRGVRLEVEG